MNDKYLNDALKMVDGLTGAQIAKVFKEDAAEMADTTQPREQAGADLDNLQEYVTDGLVNLTQQAAPEAPKKMYGTIGHTRIPGMSPIGDVFATAATTASASERPEAMSYADAAKWARENGLNVPAEWDRAPAPGRNASPLEDLLGQYWEIAYSEGKTGESRGSEAQAVLSKIRAALTQQSAAQAPSRDAVCPGCEGTGYSLCATCGDCNGTGSAPAADRIAAYVPGEWFDALTLAEMEAFYMSRLPAIREAAKEHGYAIGLHGSRRRDFDLMAMQWRADASPKDTLAHAIAVAACGITREGTYAWESKPAGRFAVSLPICWTDHGNPEFDNMMSLGHIDLSVIDPSWMILFIEKRAEDYLRENASTEDDTGATVWHFGEAGRDYHNTLAELADDLRAALAATEKKEQK